MMKNLTIILLIFISIKAYSQKCKTDKDPFTNEVITSFDFDYKTIYFEIKNDTIRFDIKFNYWGERKHVFGEDSEILIKLEDNSTISLKTIKKAKPKIESITSSSNGPFFPGFGSGINRTSSEKFTAYSFTFLLNKTELNRLAESKIEIIRIPDTDEGEHVDLKAEGRTKKKIKAIKKGAICMIKKI
jgi:hypothetical protein